MDTIARGYADAYVFRSTSFDSGDLDFLATIAKGTFSYSMTNDGQQTTDNRAVQIRLQNANLAPLMPIIIHNKFII